MGNFKSFLGSASLLAATTIGAGMFSLPYVFKESGWLSGLFYIILLSGAVIFVHHLYWIVLSRADGKTHLLSLVRDRLGKRAFYAASIAVVTGLFLTLVIYLILAQNFMRIVLPEQIGNLGAVLFWSAASLPILLRLQKLVGAEFFGTFLMVSIVLFVFATGQDGFSEVALLKPENIFLPFGAILFSLTGWAAIKPMFDWQKRNGDSSPLPKLAAGTILSAIVYILFVIGILGSDGAISTDTLSGISSWPLWKLQLLAWLGIFAIWTSYMPISLEIKNELDDDLRLPASFSLVAAVVVPLLIFLSGFLNFLGAISLAGGVFLAIQYVFIILVSKKILALSGLKKFFADLLIFVFLAAAAYEIYYFVVR